MPNKRMKIILYISDSLRADHLSCYGYHRKISLNIDSLAKDGIKFNSAFSNSTWTRSSAASILTGLYPSVHKTETRDDRLPESVNTIPQMLKTADFDTAAFSAMGNVSSTLGFNKGFDVFFDLFREDTLIEKRSTSTTAKEKIPGDEKVALPLAEDINDYLIPYLENRIDRDLFIFVWGIDTHEPYSPPEDFKNYSANNKIDGRRETIERVKKSRDKSEIDQLINLYDDEIFYTDYQIGKLIKKFKELDIYDETLFIFTSDHGESFNDNNRGDFGHGGFPYDEVINVPLIIKMPGNKYCNTTTDELVQLIDLYPTISAILGKNIKDCQGKNIMPVLEKGKSINQRVFSETQIYKTTGKYYSLRTKEWKYFYIIPPRFSLTSLRAHPKYFMNIYLREKENLFHLKDDPGEINNLKGTKKDILNDMKKIFFEWKKQNKKVSKNIQKSLIDQKNMDDLIKNQLRKLGYLE
jgi:arylsulfatase A-like enzyme